MIKNRVARTPGPVFEYRLVGLIPPGPSPKEIQAPVLHAFEEFLKTH